MKNPTGNKKPNLSRDDVREQRQELLKLKAQTPSKSVRRMIDLAIEGLEAGVPRLTPEEISDYLGRNR